MTQYLNTDLDLVSAEELTAFARFVETHGLFSLHVTRATDGMWHARFETAEPHAEPESNIAVMLELLETLPDFHKRVWWRCAVREFNVGYDCGAGSESFEQGLSGELLGRMARIGAALRWTLYTGFSSDTGDVRVH